MALGAATDAGQAAGRGDGGGGRNPKRGRNGVGGGPIVWEGGVPRRDGQALWDFAALPDGCLIHGRGASVVAESSPYAELKRAELFQVFRQRYAEVCHTLMSLEQPPADSIDRWLLEQLAQPRGAPGSCDAMLARPRIAETSRVLIRELLAEVPLRCWTRAYGEPAFGQLRRYHDSAERWLARLAQDSARSLADLRADVEALGTWLDQRTSQARVRRPTEECPFRQKLHELAGEGGLSSRFRPVVEPLALQVVRAVSDEAERMAWELTRTESSNDSDAEPVSLEEQQGASFATLRFRSDTVSVSVLHLQKLRMLYEIQYPRPRKEQASSTWDELFRRRLYVMLRRYVTFIGLDPSEQGLKGGNMHAAAPETVFTWLKEELGVRCELFASPLNCYFPRFLSAFPDVDAHFGSLGSFFDTEMLLEGSFEVGPPYTEEVMELMARRLLALLGASGPRPLSFVLFVPDWEGAGALDLLGSEAFAPYRRHPGGRAFALARGREHHYVSGIQFFADHGGDAQRRYYVVPHGTRVYVLQNDAGAARWPFTPEREAALLARMRP